MQKKLVYMPNDEEVLLTIQKRNLLSKLVKNRSISYLEAQRTEMEAKLNATKRPKGVLLKYKELIRKAQRDESTLVELENQLRAFELDYERKEEPWKLITNPTLKDGPVAPKRKTIGILGLFMGLFAGTSYSIFKQKRSGIVYEDHIIENIFNTRILEKINLSNKSFAINQKDVFLNEIIDIKASNKQPIIFISNSDKIYIENLLKNIFKEEYFYKIEENFRNLKKEDKVILLLEDLPKLNDLNKVQNRLTLVEIKLFGIILIK